MRALYKVSLLLQKMCKPWQHVGRAKCGTQCVLRNLTFTRFAIRRRVPLGRTIRWSFRVLVKKKKKKKMQRVVVRANRRLVRWDK